MASNRERIVAWVGVIVAALSAVALSAAVLIQQYITNHTPQPSISPSPTVSCADTAAEATLAIPTAYVASGTVSGLQTTDLATGSGPAAKSGDCLNVKYYGTLATNGKEFDENFSQKTGFAFTLGQGQVIAGWDQGLVGMQAGGMRRLVIPASLAYGSQSPSSAIPANSALVFVVKLIRIQNP